MSPLSGPRSAAERTTTALRPALHGDSWESPWYPFAIAGAAPDVAEWIIRAEVRRPGDTDPLFVWVVEHGDTTNTGAALSMARVRRRDRTELDLPALQLRLRPVDWIDRPTRWSGFLEIELTRGPRLAPPIERRTMLRRRRFEITPDLVP